MANNVTLLEKLVNPQVMGDMISAELEDKLQATKYFKVDRTLTGRAGDTITIPTWHYIGMADVLPENQQGTVTEMSTEDISYTVKKVVKNVTLTDEAVLSGYSDVIGETNKQLRLSIQDRMEQDAIELFKAIPDDAQHLYLDASTEELSYSVITDAIDKMRLENQDEHLFIMVGRNGIKTLRNDPRFLDVTAVGDRVLLTGQVGTIAGCAVIISNRIDSDPIGTTTKAFIYKPQVFTAFIKRDLNVESQRELLFKRTIIGSDTHYVVAIEDFSKVVVIEHKVH